MLIKDGESFFLNGITIKMLGWIDELDYPKGKFHHIAQLKKFVRSVNVELDSFRGFRLCPICKKRVFEDQLPLGSRNLIALASEPNCFFAFPDLILHYVQDHEYLPPEEFTRSLSTDLRAPTNIDHLRNLIGDSEIDIRTFSPNIIPLSDSEMAKLSGRQLREHDFELTSSTMLRNALPVHFSSRESGACPDSLSIDQALTCLINVRTIHGSR